MAARRADAPPPLATAGRRGTPAAGCDARPIPRRQGSGTAPVGHARRLLPSPDRLLENRPRRREGASCGRYRGPGGGGRRGRPDRWKRHRENHPPCLSFLPIPSSSRFAMQHIGFAFPSRSWQKIRRDPGDVPHGVSRAPTGRGYGAIDMPEGRHRGPEHAHPRGAAGTLFTNHRTLLGT